MGSGWSIEGKLADGFLWRWGESGDRILMVYKAVYNRAKDQGEMIISRQNSNYSL
jgi:hypothetical protein